MLPNGYPRAANKAGTTRATLDLGPTPSVKHRYIAQHYTATGPARTAGIHEVRRSMNTAVSNDNSRGHGCSNEWAAGRVPRPRGVHSLATRARVVRVKRKQHAVAQEPCCGRTLALRNDIWVLSIGACRSVYDNTIVHDILEPPTHALPTTWRHHCQLGAGIRPAGQDPPVEGQPLQRGTLHACYWNSLLGALTQALILTAATSQLKSDSAKGR